jgi:hypothetical protein
MLLPAPAFNKKYDVAEDKPAKSVETRPDCTSGSA